MILVLVCSCGATQPCVLSPTDGERCGAELVLVAHSAAVVASKRQGGDGDVTPEAEAALLDFWLQHRHRPFQVRGSASKSGWVTCQPA